MIKVYSQEQVEGNLGLLADLPILASHTIAHHSPMKYVLLHTRFISEKRPRDIN